METACYCLGAVIIIIQLLCVAVVFANGRYSLKKYWRDRSWYQPKTVLIIPCKGLDLDFEKNITSFFAQQFENYLLWFVVESDQDQAYAKLCELKDKLREKSSALEIKIWVAGIGSGCSQKIHNLLYCCRKIPQDVEIMAFADSDICVRPDWLSHLIYPLRQEKNGIATGYRWFVPTKNNMATLALCFGNARIVQFLGNSIFNQAWGGSMAIRQELFRQLRIDDVWKKAISDDYSITRSVSQSQKKIAYVPACLVSSYADIKWPELTEFARRQFIITRITRPELWVFAIIATTFSVFSIWGTFATAVFLAKSHPALSDFLFITASVTAACQVLCSIIRQATISSLMRKHKEKLKFTSIFDALFFWLWNLILWVLVLSSCLGRTISWRGIRYKILSPTETIILRK